jgi:hypothetical protein
LHGCAQCPVAASGASLAPFGVLPDQVTRVRGQHCQPPVPVCEQIVEFRAGLPSHPRDQERAEGLLQFAAGTCGEGVGFVSRHAERGREFCGIQALPEIQLDGLAFVVVQPGEGGADLPCQFRPLGVVTGAGWLAGAIGRLVPRLVRPINRQPGPQMLLPVRFHPEPESGAVYPEFAGHLSDRPGEVDHHLGGFFLKLRRIPFRILAPRHLIPRSFPSNILLDPCQERTVASAPIRTGSKWPPRRGTRSWAFPGNAIARGLSAARSRVGMPLLADRFA